MERTIERTRRAVAGAAVVLATTLALGLVQAPAHASAGLRTQMFKATNESRSTHAKHRLQINMKMSNKARMHSVAMAKAGALFHTSDVSVYLRGVKWSSWGENIGMTTGDVATLEDAFMHSKDHRKNILNGTFDHVAVGAIRRSGVLWVTVFFYG